MSALALESVVDDFLRKRRVPAAAPLTAAVSGGPDSMALLNVLSACRPGNIVVGHVDHGLRAESADEADFVAARCRKLGVTYRGTRLAIDAAGPGNLAAKLREARYAFLMGLVPDDGFLVTAHHADDQAVTVLMRLIEGAALPGLGGMPAHRGRILRPFLTLPRAALMEYLSAREIPYCSDPSNDDESRFRNRVRRRILPLVAAERKRAVRNIAAAALRLREDDDALQAWADRVLAGAETGYHWVEVPMEGEEPPAVLRRILNTVLSIRWGRGPLPGLQWPQLAALLESGARANLPGRVTVRRLGHRLVFTCQSAPPDYRVDISCAGDYVLPTGVLRVTRPRAGSLVRPVGAGDRIDGRRAVDILKRHQVPAHRRGGWPVLEVDGALVAVFPPGAPLSNGGGQLTFEPIAEKGFCGLESGGSQIVKVRENTI